MSGIATSRRGVLGAAVLTATPVAPDALPNLYSWHKADGTLWQDSARTTPATADTNLVGSWDDAGPNGYHVVQATAGSRPVLHTGGPNGLPYIQGDNVGTALRKTSLPGWTGGITMFLVLKAGVTLASSDYYLSLKTSDDQSIIANFTAGRLEYFSTPRTNIGTVSTSTWAIYEFVDMGSGAASSAIGLKNGTATETLTGSSKTFGTIISLFAGSAGFFGDVAMAEVVIYTEGKSTIDRAGVRAHLGAKYAITVA